VLVVEVDALDAEPPEAALARRPHVRWVAAEVGLAAVDEGDAELGGQVHLLPHPALQRLAEEELVGVRAVAVSGVEEGDAGGDGVADERDHVGLRLGRAVVGGHAHAAEALRRDLQPLRAQLHARHRDKGSSHCWKMECALSDAGYEFRLELRMLGGMVMG
jgi:hypothetical protein